jgi:hypothetical protein
VTFGRENAVFHLGPAAARWADKIGRPPQEGHIRAAARAVDLVDVKVARLSTRGAG